ATTPVRQLYFVVQTMLMDPSNAGMTAELYKHLSFRTRQAVADETIQDNIDVADKKVNEGRYFDALRQLRNCFSREEKVDQKAQQNDEEAA
ncbi:MAG: flagellar biosynthesis repressor FlbT, partial [Aestuariivirga sp.]|uniref:flagellar biosynthesis repressor FlbT n=1 Tax=Aestuariivirga sp. TaxID=2650926 RepID=UPI00301A6783